MIAPLALIVGLALAGGGFDLAPRHIAGLAVWLLVVVLLAFGAAGRATLGAAVLLGEWADRGSGALVCNLISLVRVY